MAALDQILHLSESIAENAKIISHYFHSQQTPPPSWHIDGPPKVNIPPRGNVTNAYNTVLAATKDLHALLLGPMGLIMSMGMNLNDLVSLQAIYQFKIASTFPVGEEASFESISEKCGMNVIDTRRLLRFAMTNHIFSEPRPGFVAHTSVSKLLACNPLMESYVGISSEEHFPAATRTVDAITKFGFAHHPKQSGWSLANNSNEGLYASFGDGLGDRGHRWAQAMSAFASRLSLEPLLASYAWNDLDTIVDVGGGQGPVSVGIARRFSRPKFVVQDLSDAVELGSITVPEELKERIRFEVQSFLEPQTRLHADAYLFRAVFTNWPDAFCVKILQCHVHALASTSKLLIYDGLLPEPGSLPPYTERQRRSLDLNMLTYFGARHRTVSDWKEILKDAHKSLELERVVSHPDESAVLLVIRLNANVG